MRGIRRHRTHQAILLGVLMWLGNLPLNSGCGPGTGYPNVWVADIPAEGVLLRVRWGASEEETFPVTSSTVALNVRSYGQNPGVGVFDRNDCLIAVGEDRDGPVGRRGPGAPALVRQARATSPPPSLYISVMRLPQPDCRRQAVRLAGSPIRTGSLHQQVTLLGYGFAAGPRPPMVTLGNGIAATLSESSPVRLTFHVPRDLPLGPLRVRVANPDGGADTRDDLIEIIETPSCSAGQRPLASGTIAFDAAPPSLSGSVLVTHLVEWPGRPGEGQGRVIGTGRVKLPPEMPLPFALCPRYQDGKRHLSVDAFINLDGDGLLGKGDYSGGKYLDRTLDALDQVRVVVRPM